MILSSSYLFTDYLFLHESCGTKSAIGRFWTSWNFSAGSPWIVEILHQIRTAFISKISTKYQLQVIYFSQCTVTMGKRLWIQKTRIWQHTGSTFGQLRVFETTEGRTNSLLNCKISWNKASRTVKMTSICFLLWKALTCLNIVQKRCLDQKFQMTWFYVMVKPMLRCQMLNFLKLFGTKTRDAISQLSCFDINFQLILSSRWSTRTSPKTLDHMLWPLVV